MKNILLIWNIILTALIVYLFINNGQGLDDKATTSDTLAVEKTLPNADNNTVYYINTDSLFNGFEMYSDLEKDLINDQVSMRKRYENQLKKLESEYNDLREKAPYMTQSQGEAAQQKLMLKQQDLVKMEEQLTATLSKKETQMVRKIKEALTTYLKAYQNEKGYKFVLGKNEIGGVLFASEDLDLTNEVLKGLNENYNNVKSL